MKIFRYDEISSTQDYAKAYLSDAAKTAAFVADSQTNCYGKQGRSYYSPKNTGIYFSIAKANFRANLHKIGLLTPYISFRIVSVLKDKFKDADFKIKWVNDIYLNDKKVAGILTEQVTNGIVIGVGINLTTTNFPAAIQNKAGNITSKIVDKPKLINNLLITVLLALEYYDQIDFMQKYRKLSYVIGKHVSLQIGKNYFSGKVIDIDETGRIVVAKQNDIRKFNSGDIIKVNFVNN